LQQHNMKGKYQKVQDNPSLVRDNSSDAIININDTAYKARLRR